MDQKQATVHKSKFTFFKKKKKAYLNYKNEQ